MKEKQEKFCRYCGKELRKYEWNEFVGGRIKNKHRCGYVIFDVKDQSKPHFIKGDYYEFHYTAIWLA